MDSGHMESGNGSSRRQKSPILYVLPMACFKIALHSTFRLSPGGFEDGKELVYLHIEAPDECGHQGDAEGKVKSLEIIDRDVLSPVVSFLENRGESFAVLVTPDHPTPLSTRGHSSADVPFMLYYNDEKSVEGHACYCEKVAGESGIYIDNGYDLIDLMIARKIKKEKNLYGEN